MTRKACKEQFKSEKHIYCKGCKSTMTTCTPAFISGHITKSDNARCGPFAKTKQILLSSNLF